MTWQWKLWWVLFVFLPNFAGLIFLTDLHDHSQPAPDRSPRA